jgi:hypothetical protein
MSEQLDSAFQTGMAEHTFNAQQQLASTNSALATTLQVLGLFYSFQLKVTDMINTCPGFYYSS